MTYGAGTDYSAFEWVGILDAGEKIVWQGRPSGGLRASRNNLLMSAFGLFFAFPSLMGLAINKGEAGSNFNSLMTLPFIAIGAYLTIGQYFYAAYLRRHTWYTVTNKRAIVATNAFGKKLRSWPITKATILDFMPGEEATIFFATEIRRDGDGGWQEHRVGFEYIRDGQVAYQLIRKIQSEMA